MRPLPIRLNRSSISSETSNASSAIAPTIAKASRHSWKSARLGSPANNVAGLAVMRSVAMLVNEAADAVMQEIATAHDIDLAMQKGVSDPLGPLARGSRIGLAPIRDVLMNLAGHY